MDKQLLWAFTFAVLCNSIIVANGYTNKYSERINKDDTINNNNKIARLKPFRMKQTNLLWTTARKLKNLDEEKMSDLFRDLEKHDRLEMRLKKMRSENGDQDGLMEEKALHNFKRVADKYSLNEEDVSEEAANLGSNKTDPDKDSVYFEDFKLRELWAQAQASGFSGEDLALLQQEFTHQQMKIDQFTLMHNEELDVHDPEDNSVHMDNDLDLSLKDDTKDRLIVQQRDRMAIQEGFSQLEHLTATLTPVKGEFTDARVNSLWVMAQRSNWTSKELDSFKDELHHFQKRLSKQKVYNEQLQVSRQKLKHRKDPETHNFLEEKHNILDKEVKKYHSGLKLKLSKALRHSEL